MWFGNARSFLNVSRAKRFFHRGVHRVKLMVASHLLGNGRAIVFEYEKMPDKIEKSPLIEDAAEQNLQLRCRGGRNCLTGYGAPWHEALAVCADRSDSRL